jgi:hypothetical protein
VQSRQLPKCSVVPLQDACRGKHCMTSLASYDALQSCRRVYFISLGNLEGVISPAGWLLPRSSRQWMLASASGGQRCRCPSYLVISHSPSVPPLEERFASADPMPKAISAHLMSEHHIHSLLLDPHKIPPLSLALSLSVSLSPEDSWLCCTCILCLLHSATHQRSRVLISLMKQFLVPP